MSRETGKTVSLKGIIVVLVIVAAIAIGGFFLGMKYGSNNTTSKSITTKLGFENLGELATQVAHTNEIINVEKAQKLFDIEIPFTSSKQIFVYPINVKAGLNFNDIKYTVDDVNKTITVRLPEIKVLSLELDTENCQVLEDSTGLFTKISIDDHNNAINNMKETAIDNSIHNGLLNSAKENAENIIKGYFSQQYNLDNEYTIKFV